MSRHPEVKWAQRLDKVYLTVLLPDSKNAKINLDPEGAFTFSGTAGPQSLHYELTLDLFDKVNVEKSKISVGVRGIVCVLEKVDTIWWKKLLRGDGKTPHNVKVDWDKWVDEDDEDTGPADLDMGDINFSSFGDMGGGGGMGEDMDDDSDEDDDEDDDDDEVGKLGEKDDAGKVETEKKPHQHNDI